MLRAISEMAVATTASSPLVSPICPASARLSRRAATMSWSWTIGIRISAATGPALPALCELGQAILEVERGGHLVEGQAELDHREGDVGLDADDHRVGAAQGGDLGDAEQGARRERV